MKSKFARVIVIMMTIVLTVSVILIPASVYATDNSTESDLAADRRVVKVGYFSFDGYHMIDDKGQYSGYGYDVLQMLSRYNDWEIQYVGYDCSWSEAQKMLAEGEIDILTSAQKTESRERIFDFSANSIGTSSTILTVKAGNDDISPSDYSTYNGMKVGMIPNNSRNSDFEDFADEKGFSYTEVFFDTTDSLCDALQDNIVDTIVSSNLRSIKGETILDEFAASDFYVCVKKGNTELMSQINYAITQLDINNAGWRYELFSRYYIAGSSGEDITFTTGERTFLQNLSNNGKALTVLYNPDRKPYSYLENGQPQGIAIHAFEEIAERLGIKYEYINVKDREEYTRFQSSGEADLIIDARVDYYQAEKAGYQMSDTYMKTSISRIIRTDFYDSVYKVAALKNPDASSDTISNMYYTGSYIEYSSVDECVDAVINGKCDATYVYSYVAERIVNEDVRGRLTCSVVPDYTIDLGIAVSNRFRHELLAVINKGVSSIKGQYMQGLILSETARTDTKMSVIDYLYNNPNLAILLAVVFISILFVIAFLVYRSSNITKAYEQSSQLARFMGYVCQVNDMVMEVNLESGQFCRYVLDGDEIKTEHGPYQYIDYGNEDGRINEEDFKDLRSMLTKENLDEMIKTGSEGWYFESRTKDVDDDFKWFSYTIRPIKCDKQHPHNFILFKKNINDFKLNEEKQKQILKDALNTAKEASAAKGGFLSRMSHEIRTPLNAIIGYLSMAKMDKDDYDKVMHCVDNGELAAKHLLSIINDVLDISSIESGKMKISETDFDLKSQISTISSIFYSQAKNKDIIFKVSIKSLDEEWVVGDQLRLNQILMNLLSNAIKFTPEKGSVILSVEQMKVEDRNVHIKFEVKDTGIGMSKEYLEKIFTPFEQESASTARKYGGTGLGLSITKNLVTMMGGSIEVASVQNEGTTFTVIIAFGKSEENSKEHSLNAKQDFSKVRALIVDDQENECEYIKNLLKRCGVRSDVVNDGQSAVEQIKRRMGGDYSYDMCIMDWNMPEIDGVETAKMIHEQCNQDIPIIIATAYDVGEIEKTAKEAGVSRVIAKPLFQSTMFDILVNSFGKYIDAEKIEPPKIALTGVRVLLAEDNAMNREIAVDILKKAGMIVETAEDGKEAYDKFMASKKDYYEAILMDVQMPVMDGYEATRAIRKSDHEYAKSMPIIAMTANAFTEDVSDALAAGMNDHISKPVNYDKLFKTLGKYVNRVQE